METDGSGLAGRRVLVAEDQFLVALELAQELSEWGCAVLGPVASNREALKLLGPGQARPDAALLDAELLDGRVAPVAAALAAAGVPFALLTGYDDGDLDEEPALCAAPRLGKPYGRAALRRLLDGLLVAAARPST